MPDRTYGPIRINFGRRRIKVPLAHFLFIRGQRSSCVQKSRAKFDFSRRVGIGPASLQRSYTKLEKKRVWVNVGGAIEQMHFFPLEYKIFRRFQLIFQNW